MDRLQDIFRAIDADGFKESTLQKIDNYINDIENGRTNFPRFTQQEHAGLCKAGAALIGASVIASYARGSLTAGGDAESGQGSPANWEIDELQEQLIERWAKVSGRWFANSGSILDKNFGFRDTWSGQGVNYISGRIVLEDMHPANVFIDELTGRAICIDCIVKFV